MRKDAAAVVAAAGGLEAVERWLWDDACDAERRTLKGYPGILILSSL